MKFTKMHGLGNDYVYVNCFEEKIDNPPAVARFVSMHLFMLILRWRCTMQMVPEARCAATESVVWRNMSMITG